MYSWRRASFEIHDADHCDPLHWSDDGVESPFQLRGHPNAGKVPRKAAKRRAPVLHVAPHLLPAVMNGNM